MLAPKVACFVGEVDLGEPIAPNPYAQCIRDICGENASTLFSANERYVERTKPQSEQVFNEMLSHGLNDVFDTVEKNAKEALSQLSDADKAEVTAQMQVDALFTEYVQNLTESLIEAFSLSGAPIQALPYFEQEAVQAMSALYPQELVNAFERKRALLGLAMAEGNATLDGLDREQVLNTIKRERIADAAWRLPDTLGIERMQLMTQMAQTSNQVPIDSRGGHMSGNEDILLLENFISLATARELAKSEAELKEINASILAQYKASERELPDPLQKLSERLAETRQACAASLQKNLASLPTDQDIEAMRVKVYQNKSEIISEMKRKQLFSLQSTQALTKLIQNVEIRLPASKRDYANSLGALFGNLKNFSNVVGSKDKVYGALAMTRGADCFSEAKYDTNMAYYYDHGHNHDFVYLDSSAIHDFEAVGAPVMAHEIGHAVSIHLGSGKGSHESRMTRRDVTRCLRRGHVSGGFFEKLFASGPTVFSEEDFADSFAAQVKPAASNLGCSLTKDGAPSSQDLGALTQVQLNYQSVGNPNWQHSSTVYRMLHWEAATKRSLPLSCTEVMKSMGENVNFPTRCWSRNERDRD